MDLTTAEKDFETILAEAQSALPAIQTLLSVVGMFVPQAKVASEILSAVTTVAPTLIADLKKTAQDFEAALAALKPA